MALQILIILDRQEKVESRREQMRLSLLGNNPNLARALYPAYFEAEIESDDEVTEQAPEGALDFQHVEWEHPSDLIDDDFAMLSRLLGDKDVTVSGPLRPSEGVTEAGISEPLEIDDAEWT